MAVLEIGIPSGFIADKKSVTQHPLLKRTEDGDGKLNLYFDEVCMYVCMLKPPYNNTSADCRNLAVLGR